MSRFLFVVPPLAGHVNPTVAVGAELASRNHDVAWAGHASVVGRLLASGSKLFATDEGPADSLRTIARRSEGLRGVEAFRFLWSDFLIPLAEAMLPRVEAAVDQFAPDVLIIDQQTVAGALVALRRRLRWATSATTSSELANPFAIFPMFGAWLSEQLRAFQRRAGALAVETPHGDLRFSEQLVLAFSTPEFVAAGPFPPEWLFVGPAIHTRPARTSFPWSWLDPGMKHVLITLGTVNAASGARFFKAAIDAVRRFSDRLQAVVVAPDGMINTTPPGVLVRPNVPQLDLLPRIDAVICHAGHNTVCEALAHGIPLAVAPIRDDQPIVAGQVVNARAGVRLKYGRATSDDIGDALLEILETPSYRAAAQRIAASFRAAGGVAAASDALEQLARHRRPGP